MTHINSDTLIRPTELHRCDRDSCQFCAELAGISTPLHTKIIPEAKRSRILRKTERWVVVPSIGPLTPGHLMLVPRAHYFSALSCPEDLLVECDDLLFECACRLAGIYGQDVLLFEHGSTANLRRPCGACVDHAHIHVLPGPLSFVSSAIKTFPTWQAGVSLTQLRTLGVADLPYLMVGYFVSQFSLWVRECPESIPSQILRTLYACEVGNTDGWDWRKYPNPATFLQTIRDWNGS